MLDELIFPSRGSLVAFCYLIYKMNGALRCKTRPIVLVHVFIKRASLYSLLSRATSSALVCVEIYRRRSTDGELSLWVKVE